MALTIGKGAKDFHTGQKLNSAKVAEKRVDSHHIFPRSYLGDLGIQGADLILNRALIDSESNQIIGKRAPSKYLAEMRDKYGPEKLADVLDSHAISSGKGTALDQDDYHAFLDERTQLVIGLIEAATGHTVTRTPVPNS